MNGMTHGVFGPPVEEADDAVDEEDVPDDGEAIIENDADELT